jgi:hypothetical protein
VSGGDATVFLFFIFFSLLFVLYCVSAMQRCFSLLFFSLILFVLYCVRRREARPTKSICSCIPLSIYLCLSVCLSIYIVFIRRRRNGAQLDKRWFVGPQIRRRFPAHSICVWHGLHTHADRQTHTHTHTRTHTHMGPQICRRFLFDIEYAFYMRI